MKFLEFEGKSQQILKIFFPHRKERTDEWHSKRKIHQKNFLLSSLRYYSVNVLSVTKPENFSSSDSVKVRIFLRVRLNEGHEIFPPRPERKAEKNW